MRREIGNRQSFEGATADDGPQGGKIFGQGTENAEPILPVIDFKTLESVEFAVRRDERLRDKLHRAAVGRLFTHVFVGREGLHHRGGHLALQFSETHRWRGHSEDSTRSPEWRCRYRFAFMASA